MAEHGNKERITVTIDCDVFHRMNDLAEAQRDSLSGMVNRLLAIQLGLIPREPDRARRAEG